MDQGNSALNASSLIDLKAELHKKYESFRNVKIKQKVTQLPKNSLFKIKGETPKDKKVKQHVVKQPKEIDTEEDLALKKSREALEAKAKLYDKIVSNNILIDDEQKDCYLVDFQRKVLYNSEERYNDENDTVEKTVPVSYVLEQNSKPHTFLQSQASSANQRQENSTLEDPDQPTHYQNVQFNEIRDHGTGYFAFSMHESKRKEQMEELSSLRQETEGQRLKRQRLQNKRKAMLQARLTKICERKNIDQSLLKSYSNELEIEGTEMSQEENIDLCSIPLPEINLKTVSEQKDEKKPPKIRPWDIGKNNSQHFVPEKRIKSQIDWVTEKREERPVEFAPPTSYINNYR